MASLGEITNSAIRKAAQAAAVAAAPPPAASSQTARQEHYGRVITAWAAQTGPRAAVDELKFCESRIDEACLTGWDTELTAAGYTVTRAAGFCTISPST